MGEQITMSITLILSAIGTFIVTNVDNIFVLVIFFATDCATRKLYPSHSYLMVFTFDITMQQEYSNNQINI